MCEVRRVPKGRVTSTEVAERAGVSRATVSYVVNGLSQIKVAPETRERVLAAAAELGYSQCGRSDATRLILNETPSPELRNDVGSRGVLRNLAFLDGVPDAIEPNACFNHPRRRDSHFELCWTGTISSPDAIGPVIDHRKSGRPAGFSEQISRA